MMYEQQQQVRINTRSKRQIEVDKRRNMRLEDLEEDSNKLEIVDLSGLSLDSLPNPPLNLATICKLDLSNNNLQALLDSAFWSLDVAIQGWRFHLIFATIMQPLQWLFVAVYMYCPRRFLGNRRLS